MNIIRSAMAHLVIALIISVIYALWWSLSSIRLLPEPSPISNALVPIAIALFLGYLQLGQIDLIKKTGMGVSMGLQVR